jgi:hypothetical protein
VEFWGGFDASILVSRVGHEETVEGPEGAQLIDDYLIWRDRVEADYLNEFGEARYELVSVTRDTQRESRSPDYVYRYAFPNIRVFCYFKRPNLPDAPEAPKRTIGFQWQRDRAEGGFPRTD